MDGNDDNIIVLSEDDSSMESNPVSENESDDEQDYSGHGNNDVEGDNSIANNELGFAGTATLSNNPVAYSESDIQGMINSGDFGRVVEMKAQVNLTDHLKFFLLKKHFVPSSNHKFPTRMINNISRRFQLSCSKTILAWYILSQRMEGTVNIVYCLVNVSLRLRRWVFL